MHTKVMSISKAIKVLIHSPISNPSLASTSRPVNIRSRARDKPINAGNLIVPPSINGTPRER